MTNTNRRMVAGIAFKYCEFCERSRFHNEVECNYQYKFDNGTFDTHVFCSKVCFNSWHTLNGGR